MAQDLGCRLADSTTGPSRQILRCQSGVTVEAETAADVHVVDQAGKGTPDGARVEKGAALIDVPPHYPGGFQILTPRAIAAVRGTSWVVDVGASDTSVFVIRGSVLVHRVGLENGVTLAKGDGVDVDGTTQPLRVMRWSSRRAAALLVRFGR